MADVVMMGGGVPVDEDWAKKFIPVPPVPRLTVEQQTRLSVLEMLVAKNGSRGVESEVTRLTHIVLHGTEPPKPPRALDLRTIELAVQPERLHREKLGDDRTIVYLVDEAIADLQKPQ